MTPPRRRAPEGGAATRHFFDQTFHSLRSRNYRLLFWGQLISNTGNWLTLVALTLLVLRITGSGFDVGLLTVFQFGPILLLSAWAGVIADRSIGGAAAIAAATWGAIVGRRVSSTALPKVVGPIDIESADLPIG